MINSDRIEQIAENLDKLVYDFIPELAGFKISMQTKVRIVEDSYRYVVKNESQKSKLFISLPHPFLADWVCKHKDQIKNQIFEHIES